MRVLPYTTVRRLPRASEIEDDKTIDARLDEITARASPRAPRPGPVDGSGYWWEETIMPKKKESRDAPPVEDTQKLYARAYGARLAKQVAEELESSRRAAKARKKPDGNN